MLSEDQINEYHLNGVLVIENVLTDEEVEIAREGMHKQLLGLGIDHDGVLNGEQVLEDGVRIKGKASRIFYNKWKINVHLHDKVYRYMKQLMEATYFSGRNKGYEHPFEKSTDILAYIDRICWRLPDVIKSEGGLGLHLDRNPVDPYLKAGNGLTKWKPIQSFVALTDQYGSNSGGLKVVKGFHHRINDYFAANTIEQGENGEFYRLNSKSHAMLAKELQPINAPKGSLVCWDNRLPHATCQHLDGHDTREVVYVGWLPNIELNKKYCQQQLDHIRANIAPPAYYEPRATEISDLVAKSQVERMERSDRNWAEEELSQRQKSMIGIDL